MATVSAAAPAPNPTPTPSPAPSPTPNPEEGEAEEGPPPVDAAEEIEAKAKAAKERYSGVAGWFGRIVSSSPKSFVCKCFFLLDMIFKRIYEMKRMNAFRELLKTHA